MQNGVHFISGLPRSGSTLLAAILRQNPRFHAAMSSPLAEIYLSLCRSMGSANEYSLFMSDHQRRKIVRAVFEAYYEEQLKEKVVFDTNRAWTAALPVLADLFPGSRLLCCLRSPAWILDSVERHIQRNLLRPPRMFSQDANGNVYTRVEA